MKTILVFTNHLKKWLFVYALVSSLVLIGCTEEDTEPVCGGCDAEFPWSVVGADQCYASYEDCRSSEKGNCTICN